MFTANDVLMCVIVQKFRLHLYTGFDDFVEGFQHVPISARQIMILCQWTFTCTYDVLSIILLLLLTSRTSC